MKILSTIAEYRSFYDSNNLRQAGKTLGFVPTLGALHDGHLSLVRAAKAQCDTVVVSIFVNPLQFGPDEDFDAYPRTLERDAELLAGVGVDAIFAPTKEQMYAERHQTIIANQQMASILCGAHRPGHFEGVLTVVLMLYQIIQPTHGFFGEKDRQQLTMIKKMISDLHVPWQIVGCPTVREASGLAMSSRNRYLSGPSLEIASRIYAGLCAAKATLEDPARQQSLEEVKSAFHETVTAGGGMTVEYFEILSSDDLVPLKGFEPSQGFALFAACFLDGVRLIDNVTGSIG